MRAKVCGSLRWTFYSARSLSAPGRGQRPRPTRPPNEKSFRETLNPLKSLKTAKSADFQAQGYQRLSKTRDFAGETISFRFRFVWAAREISRPETGHLEGLKNLENAPSSKKAFFSA
jgi:hypothetical protein